MKKILFILFSLLVTSTSVQSQINFNLVTHQLPSKKTTIEAVEIGDVNNDGLNDIVAGSGYYFDSQNDYSVFVFKQNTDGTLADHVKIGGVGAFLGLSDIEIADMNNDHLNDVVVAYGSNVAILHQLSSGGFGQAKIISGTISTYGIKIGDINNDGLKDILGYDYNSNFRILYQNSSGDFTLTSSPSKTWYCTQVELGDVNGDNLVDMMKIYDSTIEIRYQKNGADITRDSTFIIDTHIRSTDFAGITIGDLNNDGRNDIVATYGGNDGRYNIYYQKPNGQIDTANVKTVTTYDIPKPVKIADLNCDGVSEIIIGHSGWFKISVFEKPNMEDYNHYNLFNGMSYYNPFSMAVDDINNDGRCDVVSVGQDATINIHYNNSKPLTFESYETKVINLQMRRDTADVDTVEYIVINDTAQQCIRNRSIRQLKRNTYANEIYSGDSLLIRKGMLCTSFTDTVKTAFTYTKSTLLGTVITESLVNFDTLSTSTTSIYTSAGQSSRLVFINANICWQVNVDADWIVPSQYSGQGDMNLVFMFNPNPKVSERTAKITISGDSVPPIMITVYQHPAQPFINSPTSVVVLSEKVNNTAYVDIVSNTNWIITKDVEWLSFNKTSGADNDLIIVQGTQNETNADRMGNIVIEGNASLLKKIVVLQLKNEANAIDNIQESECNIYPNPVKSKLIVESGEQMDNAQIHIFDLNGILRLSENLTDIRTEIDLSSLSKGIYVVKVGTETRMFVRRIIKD